MKSFRACRQFVIVSMVALLAGGTALAQAQPKGKVSATVSAANLQVVQGLDALKAGKAKRAEELLTQAIESRTLDPETLARALVNRALARQKLKRLKDAVRDYDAALAIDALSARTRAVALYNRGLAWRALGKPARAAEDFTSAIYLDPHFAQAYYSRATVLFRFGQNVFARADFEKALKYGHPQPHLVHYGLALVNLALDEREKAQAALQAALQEKPDFAPARTRLAQLLKEDGVRLADLGTGRRAVTAGSATARRIAQLAGNAETNLRRRARPQPVAPAAAGALKPSVPAVKRRSPAADRALMVASITPVKAKEARQADAHASKSPQKVARVEEMVTDKAVKGQTAKALGMKNEATITVTPVSAPAVHQNIESAPAGMKSVSVSLPQAAVTEEAAQPALTGWAIQLSSQKSEAAAWNHWKKLQRRVKRIVKGAKPVVMKAEIAGRGTYYRLRLVGYDNRRLPLRLCKRLKRSRVSCLVTKAGS